MFKKALVVIGLAAGSVLLSGCAAIGTAVAHRSLETQTSMSRSVFLDPVADSQKTVFLQMRNTASQGFNIRPALIDDLVSKGYRIKQDPALAHYVVQVNVLRVGRMSKTASREMMGVGYGGTLEGAAAGAAVMGASGGNVLAGGLVGAVAGTVVDNLVTDVNYTSVVDVKITEKQAYAPGAYRIYKTRVVATANRVNLKYVEARPQLEEGVARSIAGIF